MKFSRTFVLIIILLTLSCTFESEGDFKWIFAKNKINVEEITIDQIQTAYQNGDYTITELVQIYLDRIEEIDQNGPALNSVLQLNPDALEIARELDKEMQNGKIRGPMHGIPVLLKDNIDTHDKMNTTAGANVLENSKPLQDSWVAQKFREGGAVILGKANLSE